MKRKGFTLIELLAVIVTLAVIALISTPIIISVLDRARKEAFRDSAYGIISAAKLYYADASLDGSVASESFSFPENTKLKIAGEKPKSGNLTLDEEGKIELAISNGTWCATKSKDEEKVTITDYSVGTCKIPIENEELAACFVPEYKNVTDFDINYEECIKYLSSSTCNNQPDTMYLDGMTLKEFYLQKSANTELPILLSNSIIENVKGEADFSSVGAWKCDRQNIEIPAKVNGTVIKRIGAGVFAPSIRFPLPIEAITSVKIPNTITSIGSQAFYNNQLTSIVIPNSVKSIESEAFSTNQLENMVIGSGVESIGSRSFTHNQLTNINIPQNVHMIEGGAFADNKLPDEQAFIYARNNDGTENKSILASYGGMKKKDVIIPNEVTEIADSAFYNDTLTSVQLPNNLTSIGDNAFHSNALTSISFPNSVTNIGKWAFTSNRITTLIIPSQLTTIDYMSFSYNKLTNLLIPDNITNIKPCAFCYNELKDIVIPNYIKEIEDNVFFSNQLTNIEIPNNVTSIGMGSFAGNSLQSVSLSNTLTSMGESAFRYNKLTTITIPSSVDIIGKYAFASNQSNMKVIVNKSENSIDGSPWGASSVQWNG